MRLAWIFLAIAVTAVISYVIRVQVIRWLQRPLGATLFYSSPAGSFNFILKLSTMIGMFVAMPVIFYQLLRFIEPALPIRISRRLMTLVIGSSFILALAGIAFGYFYMIPESLHFFAGYATAQIKPLISANEYLTYLINNLVVFAIVFQIPLIILLINRIKPLKPSLLLRYQRHVVVGSAALAVVLPFTYDPVSQFIVAIPIVVLFYLSIILLWIANRKRKYPEATMLVDQPINTPIPTPAPARQPQPLFPQILPPVTTVSKSLAMEGMIARPMQNPTPRRTEYANTIALRQPVTSQTPNRPSLPRPRLTIDGISPPLPSSI